MDKILHDPKDPKLWELWYIPYNGSCRILSINRRRVFGSGVDQAALKFDVALTRLPGPPQWPFNGAPMVLNSGYLGYISG